ncbi:uncharacterized protein EDB91DRAFT_1056655, partial [Suillus paluster]|uniref:uncharacterized protein n=1 Tax=Suillus paluster TaxID=48578 RepID=UPI001B87994A
IKTDISWPHSEGYVYGDIRNAGIMIKQDGGLGFKLIDFNWSGKRDYSIFDEYISRRMPLET